MSAGRLLIIGGKEDQEGDCRILNYLVDAAARDGCIGIVTAASADPESTGRQYREVLADLGAARTACLFFATRKDADKPELIESLRSCAAVFFTGGDQLRLTGLMAGTEFDRTMRRLAARGMHICGTSAGAAAMSSTMIVGGRDDDPPKKCTIKMAPGLGLLPGTVIDQHFADRGRIGRLLSAVAQGPHVIGLGIDEDTAIVVEPDRTFYVLGSQTVTVIDGYDIGLTNASDRQQDEPLALTSVRLHVLPDGYRYDLVTRSPRPPIE